MSIYYKYAPDGTKCFVLSYVDDCVYWYTYEALGKWFLETLGRIFQMSFLVFLYWFMSIIISQLEYHSISVDQAIYSTSAVDKHLDISKFKKSAKFYKTTFPSDMIFTKDDVSTSDDSVEKLSREFNIH